MLSVFRSKMKRTLGFGKIGMNLGNLKLNEKEEKEKIDEGGGGFGKINNLLANKTEETIQTLQQKNGQIQILNFTLSIWGIKYGK